MLDSSQALAERIIRIIARQLDVDRERIVPEASFMDELGADSLDTVELVMALEEEFGIEIPDEEAEKIRTVGDCITYVEGRREPARQDPRAWD